MSLLSKYGLLSKFTQPLQMEIEVMGLLIIRLSMLITQSGDSDNSLLLSANFKG